MTDYLVKRLRDLVGQHIGDADIDDELSDAADRIEKLEEEIGVLFSANVWLNSRVDLDSDGYVDRIEKLEAFVETVIRYAGNAGDDYLADKARKALEGKGC